MSPQFNFYCLDKTVELAYPIISASEIELPWVKKSQDLFAQKRKNFSSTRHSGAHMCSGIVNLMNMGWVLTAPHDFLIETKGDGVSFTWKSPAEDKKIGHFGSSEYGDFAKLPINTLKTIIKVDTPWRFKAPKGWGLMMIPLQYIDEDRFSSAVGILNETQSNILNSILYWHDLKNETHIKAGTPLCQLIPIKLNDFKETIIRPPTKKEIEYEEILAGIRKTRWVCPAKIYTNLYNKFFGEQR